MKTGCEFRPKTERVFGLVQQKPQNDKRARRCYRCDPLGHVLEHALGAGLALPCLASLLELQDVASLGSETSGLAKFAPYLLPGLILLGIAIEPFPIAQQPIFLNKIASSSTPSQHGGDSIQMALLDFVFDSDSDRSRNNPAPTFSQGCRRGFTHRSQ